MPLGPGSIAFVGFNADGNDDLAFVALDLIPSGTVIYFSDNEWNGSPIGAGGAFNTGESYTSWTATSDVAAGTIVTLTNFTGGTTSNVGTLTPVTVSGSANRGIAASNETVYAYLGSSATTPTTFLTAITNSTFTAADGPLTNTGLTAEVNAIALTPTGSDVAVFTGARDNQANFADYAAIINNSANWISQDGSGDQSTDGIAPDVPFATTSFTLAAPLPTLSISDPSVAEGNSGTTILTYTVTASAPAPAGGITFDIATADGTATAGPDYVAKSLTAQTIPSGSTTYTFDVVINGDTSVEPNETVLVNLTNVANATIAKGQGVGTITNDDASSTAVTLSSLDVAYTQDFNTLANTGTSSALPVGWVFLETGTNANTTYTAGTGSGNAGDTYSFGAAGSTERALGTLLSGSLTPTVGAFFFNNTGATITSLDISYTGEEWRFGATGRADRLDFQYSTDATSLSTGTWADADTLDFTSPDTVGSVGARDGNSSSEQTTLSATLTGLNIAPGATFAIRWSDFNASGADDGLAVDNFSLTPHSGAAASTVSIADASIAEGDSGTKVLTFTVNRTDASTDFTVDYTTADGTAIASSDYVGVTGAPNTLHFTAGGALSQQISITINGDTTPEPNETFTVTLGNLHNTTGTTTIANGTATGTIVNDDVAITPIYTIQGAGHTSPLVNQAVITRGVVTAVDTNGGEGSRGFYIQDASGDGNAATSDGIFVFLPSGNLPTVGHLVQVSGTVQEFTPSGAAAGSFSTTEISSVTNITDLGAGPAITPVQIGATGGLLPPTSDLVAGAFFYESLESMLVIVKAPTAVGPTNSFGEIFTVVDNDNDASNGIGGATGLTARGALLVSGGQTAFGDTDTVGGDFNPERIQIDADTGMLPGFTTPQVDTGAHLSDVTGIVTYAFANYQVLATQAYSVTQASTLARETGTLSGDTNHLVIASYNAENLDPNAADGDDDVGAGKFDTIANQIFNTLHAPDILAMQEIQDEDGAAITGDTSAAGTLQLLVDKLNALSASAGGSAHYSYIDNPFINNNVDGTANGGQPGGNIRTAYIYRDDRVSLVSNSLKTLAADGTPITTPGGNTDQATNPDNPFYQSRPPLVATFRFNGQDITVIDNHFTSKGGSAALLGTDQPPFDAGEVTRAAQAQAVNNFIDSVLAANPNAKIVVAGDLNEFQFEEPLNVLKGTATVSNYNVPGTDPITATATYTSGGVAVLTDLQDQLPADQRYDYVFEGNSETLDHLLVSNNLAATTQFDIVHLNAEFAVQTSDHEPLTASLYIAPVISGQQSFTLAAGGVLVAPSGPAIAWDLVPPTTGTNATIDNAGIISATSGRAIDTTGSSNGNNHFTLINHAGASISSPGDAFRINANLPNGVVTIDNAGAIQSTGTGSANGQALDFNNITATTVSTIITNKAGGIISAADADAIRPGANATINNYGEITGASFNGSTGNDGIDFQNNGYGSVHNFSGGSIVGARHGITSKLALAIDNDSGASITGQLGSGINLDTASNTTTIVNNSGTITGNAGGASDGDGIDVDGLITLNNYGLIQGLGTWNGGLSEAVTVGGGAINNYAGGMIYSVQRAITVDDSNLGNAFGATTIYNGGTIQGASGEAISITDTFADTLTNKGSVIGSVALGGGDDVLDDYTGATFSAAVDGGDGTDTVDLYGAGQGNFGSFVNFEVVNLFSGDWTIGSEGFSFANLQSGAQTLRLASATLPDRNFDPTIQGFGSDDVIDLKGIGTATHATLGAGNVLTVTGGSAGPITLQLDPTQDFAHQVFKVVTDNDGGTLLTVAADQAPVAQSDSASGAEDHVIVGQLFASDPDGLPSPLIYGVVSGPQHGQLALTPSGSYTYTPDADFNGADSFTFAANDGILDSNIATVNLTITEVNDAPTANPDNAVVAEDVSIVISVLGNDSRGPANESGQTLAVVSASAQHGSVIINADGTLTYKGNADYNGSDTISYTIKDNGTTNGAPDPLQSNGTVAITVTPVNDAPVFTSSADFSVAENQTAVGSVIAIDPEHDAFVFAKAGGSDQAFFAINAHTGALSFVNAPDYETPEDANHDNVYDVVVSATDAFGASSTQTIHVNVTNLSEPGKIINGGNGNDILTGTTGNDTIDGGNGNDTINAGDGNDNVSGGNGNDILIGGRGNDALDGGNGDDTLDGGVGNNQLFGGDGNDIMRAGNGNNLFDGGNGDDTITAGDGNNTINSGNGNDTIAVGNGNNTITTGNGNDRITAGDGNNTICGGNGNEIVTLGNGNNTFVGGNGNDQVTASNGNNSLSGANGNDVFRVGTGNNTLTGGGSSDTFVFGPGFGKNVITDFAHGDHIEFDGGAFANFQAVQAAIHQVGADTVISLDPGHTITLQHYYAANLHASDFLFG
jgi:VCBS repeat-containing protein